MKILVDIGHPAHVHLFKNIIWNLEERGHEVMITAKDKEITLHLLDAYGFEYESLERHHKNLLGKLLSLIIREYKLYKVAREFKPDIFISHGSMFAAHVSKLLGKPHISLEDTEISTEQIRLYAPFTDVILTPTCFKLDLGKKQVRYNGYHELAYLHPKYFKPDMSVLDEMDVSRCDTFIILRFISWGASHDIKLKGIDRGKELEFIKSLEHYGSVFITSERKLDRKLEKYRITTPPEKIHSLLYYADLYIGEGGTMAAEAAILGTPAIHIESTSKGIATGEFTGNFLELRDKYGLLYFYPDQNQALEKAISILEDKNSKDEWRKKREKLLKDKIDVTAWMVNFIERYPESFYEYKRREKDESV
ncbi:MAG: putative glycosyltransferase [Candidatus Alkanophagales archaeon MCA70_species_2]|nr:putative glycosyltransferase [Candidatus Alkanophaga liquidiphilum]